MINQYKKLLGFSLVELMATLAVVMVLVSLALPRYRLFVASSRQAEAQANLGIIASLQQTYYLKYDQYFTTPNFELGEGAAGGDCSTDNNIQNELGFRVVNCAKLRYTYSPTDGGGSALNDGNRAGKAIYPGCDSGGSKDAWEINDERVLTHSENAISKCSN